MTAVEVLRHEDVGEAHATISSYLLQSCIFFVAQFAFHTSCYVLILRAGKGILCP